MSYVLRFPFTLTSGRAISGLDETIEQDVDRLRWKLEKRSRDYLLTVTGFNSEDEAKDYLGRIWSGCHWLLLQRGIPIIAQLELDKVTYTPDPEQAAKNFEKQFGFLNNGPLHGLVHDNMPAVISTDLNFRFYRPGVATVTVATPANQVVECIADGMNIRGNNSTLLDRKLKVALDLYAAFFSEYTDNAKFITLVTVLEVLKPNIPRLAAISSLIDEWIRQIETHISQLPPESDNYQELIALKQEIGFRKSLSIKGQIEFLVRNSLEYLGHSQVEELVNTSGKVYDLRSNLLHGRQVDATEIRRATSTARELVSLVLQAEFKRGNVA